VFFDSLWKDFGVRFLGVLENLARHRDLVDREASSIAIIEAKKWRALQKDDIDRREIERRDQRLQDCISWLAIHDRSQEDDLDRLSQRRQSGTCEWVLSSAHLRTWVENQNEEPVLWLKGIPGAGRFSSFTKPPQMANELKAKVFSRLALSKSFGRIPISRQYSFSVTATQITVTCVVRF
jgi:hypothetical protein